MIGSRSVQHISSKWGVNRSTINNYLKRGSKPRIDILTKAAAAEDVSVEWLIYGHVDSIETTGQGQEEIRELTQPKDFDKKNISNFERPKTSKTGTTS
ncbi:XRE family transcriptional regulator [Sodalis-like symbiont of Bactericera trigonica]|nr:XRE family transcriptional regulator [Sodalis-like symbiont of Bactericera trigonica]